MGTLNHQKQSQHNYLNEWLAWSGSTGSQPYIASLETRYMGSSSIILKLSSLKKLRVMIRRLREVTTVKSHNLFSSFWNGDSFQDKNTLTEEKDHSQEKAPCNIMASICSIDFPSCLPIYWGTYSLGKGKYITFLGLLDIRSELVLIPGDPKHHPVRVEAFGTR